MCEAVCVRACAAMREGGGRGRERQGERNRGSERQGGKRKIEGRERQRERGGER